MHCADLAGRIGGDHMELIIGIGIAIVVAAVLFFAWVLCRAASDGRDD